MVEALCGFNSNANAHGADLLMAFGPTLLVNIGFDAAWTATSGSIPQSPAANLPALVDTGASASCIDQILA
ncbi:MAG: hypothetical protein ACREP9_05665, partial [Candidatus Dormibacteraceae bacterium]